MTPIADEHTLSILIFGAVSTRQRAAGLTIKHNANVRSVARIGGGGGGGQRCKTQCGGIRHINSNFQVIILLPGQGVW